MPTPPTATAWRSGPITEVPCPHCGKNNDFTEILEEVENDGSGNRVECDHCGKVMEIVQIKRVTTISVRQA
jgi:uncharacterized Zn finger protein